MLPSALFSHIPLSSPWKSSTILPAFIYGTAWKKELTSSLVVQALQNNFTAIDTACQPRHYREDLVGAGIRKFLSTSCLDTHHLRRSDLYVQSKFTSVNGQDPDNIPYDPKASITEQVQQSVDVSLRNFTFPSSNEGADSDDAQEPHLDTLVLHSPYPDLADTLEAWSAMESFVPHQIHHLGISNTNLFTLMDLCSRVTIKPSIVQNRFYPSTKHDIALRKFCAEHGIVYQSFWTLTGNPGLLKSRIVRDTATTLGVGKEQALYVLVIGLGGVTVCNGTTSEQHMRQDWDATKKAAEYANENATKWESLMNEFRRTIGEKID